MVNSHRRRHLIRILPTANDFARATQEIFEAREEVPRL